MNTIYANIGDHLVASRFGYTHHGIYIGGNSVIHYLDEDGVTIDSFETFSRGEKVYVREHPNRVYSPQESVDRAYERLGDDNYNVIVNNCEHFVNWCINGLHVSAQVNRVALCGAAPFVAREIAKKAAPTVIRTVLGTTAGASTLGGATLVAETTARGAASIITASSLSSAALGGTMAIAVVPVCKGIKNVVENFDYRDNPLDAAAYFCEGVGDCISDAVESVGDMCSNVGDFISSFFD